MLSWRVSAAALAPALARFALCEDASPASSPPTGCPMHNSGQASNPQRPPSPLTGGCPVQHKKKVYNVYSEEIDPTNMMPPANQDVAPGQKYPLATERVQSTIPKGGTDGTWSYPSPQMFYNALVRKNKSENVEEKDVAVIVAIHNNMNETTWKHVIQYEKLCHPETAHDVKLLKFIGRPDELSPIAWLKSWLGYGTPFDRHDWTIDRDGTIVRYVIDYYHDDTKEDELPGLHSENKVQSISLYVRPALDSPSAALDRIRMGFNCFFGTNTLKPQEQPDDDVRKELDYLEVKDIDWRAGMTSAQWSMMRNRLSEKCEDRMQQWKQCSSQEERQVAGRMLDLCFAAIACKSETQRYLSELESGNESAAARADASLFECVGAFKQAMGAALKGGESSK